MAKEADDTEQELEPPVLRFNRPFIVGKELDYITQAVMVEGRLAGDGPFSQRCHTWMEERFGAPRALLTHSCTGALEMAALLAEVGPGDEVIMPSFTFVSTANAFVLRGGVPVFVDIRADTLNLDETLLAAAITDRTKAIVPVHYAGMACEMTAIMELARARDVLVIEDAAQGFLSTHQGRFLGTIGQLGCLSFHETKNIISGEGGALLINDPRFIERAEIIREKGTNRSAFFRGAVDKYTWIDVGSSYLPSELVAAFLYAQFEMAETIIAARARSFHRYREALGELEASGRVRLPHVAEGSSGNGHIFYLTTGSLDERTRLIAWLNERRITAVFHYVPLHRSPAGQRAGRTAGPLPVTEAVSDRVVRLPLYYGMTDAEVDRVCEAVRDFYCSPR